MATAGVEVTFTDHGLEALNARLRELGKLRATVGYQGKDATEVVGDDPMGPDTATVARINEFGAKIKGAIIPSRPYMRRAVKRSGQAIAKAAAKAAGRLVAGRGKPEDVIEAVGEVMLEGIKDQVDSARAWAVENAPRTIKKKGAVFPPLWAGNNRLREKASWAVREGRTVLKQGR